MKKNTILFILFIILAIVAARLIPHAPNFSPLASILLFTGAYATKKKYLIIPLVALFISDFFLGFYHLPVMLSVYGSFALIGLIGFVLKKRKSTLNILSSSLIAALIFFFVTNFVVWYAADWYSRDLAGLSLCYTLAIPFFKNTVLSNLLYGGLLFGSYEALRKLSKQKLLTIRK